MSARTIFLSKLMGLFLVLVGLSMLIQGRLIAETFDGMMRDAPLLFIVGIIAIACGLAIVLVHNRWTGGVLPVVVTILGWATLLKGIMLLFLPPPVRISIFEALRYGQLIYLYATIDLAIGIYLTIAGFKATARTE
jgi:hypothetical protein